MTHLHYRVWDGEQMHYWDDEGLSLIITGEKWSLYRNIAGSLCPICVADSTQKDVALIWGTGEKDEDGKMIYPGDVVEYEEPSFTGNGTEYLQKWCVIFLSVGGRHNVPTRFRRNLKVIGNAYENPDLPDDLLEAAE
ncbi:YopX family protein [Bacillus swezeyi]|uniref:YopX family protein n=1 Tax=Bacillus swezeyi TaxID=1925020 RepID=UPI002E23E713|nr:YopX family protein [Bacillus swezeyi]